MRDRDTLPRRSEGSTSDRRRRGLLGTIGPGLLVAAAGVGAGDPAAGAFSGSRLGFAVLWAVVPGAILKFVLTEGLARWQIATGGSGMLEGLFLPSIPGAGGEGPAWTVALMGEWVGR